MTDFWRAPFVIAKLVVRRANASEEGKPSRLFACHRSSRSHRTFVFRAVEHFQIAPPAAKRNSSASARHTFRAPDDHHGRDRSRMDARHRQGRAQRRQRADHGQHRPGTRTRPRRPTRRSRRFCRTLRQIRSPSRPIFPRATDRARVASHRLTPIASRDLHSQAGPPPEKTITLASLIAPRMVRPASRRKAQSAFPIRVTSAAPRLPFPFFFFGIPKMSRNAKTRNKTKRPSLAADAKAKTNLPNITRVAATARLETSPSRSRRAKPSARV